MTFEDYAYSACRALVSVLVFSVSYILYCLEYLHSVFPGLMNLIYALVALYFIYSVARRMLRFWVNVFISTIKIVFYVTIVMVLVAIYFRGINGFINYDLVLLKNFVVSFWTEPPVEYSRVLKVSYSIDESALNDFFNKVQEKADGVNWEDVLRRAMGN